MPFQILVICSANICRSPTAARALRSALREAGLDGDITVVSAGVKAADGLPMCEVADTLSSELADAGAEDHRSRLVTADLVTECDLVLLADRSHRTEVGRLAPRARARFFTLRQAARLATWVMTDSGVLEVAIAKAAGETPDLAPDDMRWNVPALPASGPARLEWFVGELDAARGLGPRPAVDPQAPQWDIDDIGDPHVEGWELHDATAKMIIAASQELVLRLRALATMP